MYKSDQSFVITIILYIPVVGTHVIRIKNELLKYQLLLLKLPINTFETTYQYFGK